MIGISIVNLKGFLTHTTKSTKHQNFEFLRTDEILYTMHYIITHITPVPDFPTLQCRNTGILIQQNSNLKHRYPCAYPTEKNLRSHHWVHNSGLVCIKCNKHQIKGISHYSVLFYSTWYDPDALVLTSGNIPWNFIILRPLLLVWLNCISWGTQY